MPAAAELLAAVAELESGTICWMSSSFMTWGIESRGGTTMQDVAYEVRDRAVQRTMLQIADVGSAGDPRIMISDEILALLRGSLW